MILPHRAREDGSVRLVVLTAILAFALAFLSASRWKPARNLLNVKSVEIEMGNRVEVRPVLAENGAAHGESFSKMMERLRPHAAINGTLYGRQMKPLGDVLIRGRLVNRGGYPSAAAFTRSGRVEFIHRRQGRLRWRGYYAGVAAGPMLVRQGKIDLDPAADGFSRRSLTIKAWRSGIGRTKRGNLLLVTVTASITLREFAEIMREQGAVDAMNLDGGGACALYHQGRVIVSPTLPMTNILAVYTKDDR